MKKLLAVLISSSLLLSGYAVAQPAAGDTSGSNMNKEQSMSGDDNMAKKGKKHKRTHKKSSKRNAEAQSNQTLKSMGTETDNSVQSKKNP